MKTPEDEAFDDLAKRQGDWGGGYRAKREAALDKILQEQLRLGVYGSVPQPAQGPVAWMDDYNACKCLDNEARCFSDRVFRMMQKYTTPPQRERVVFPTMLRKMWSGGEVQAWLDENVNKEKNT